MKKMLFVLLFLVVGCGKEVKKTGDTNPTPVPKDQIQLNGPLTSGGNVSGQFDVSSNGKKIVYVADETTDTVDDLYVVDNTGLNKRNLTNLPVGKKVTKFKISSDSQKIVFLADIDTASRFDLYRINMDGTGLVRLNQGLPSNSQLVEDNFQITNDSNRVVYLTDEEVAGVRHAYIVNLNGINRVQLTTAVGIFKNYDLAKDNDRIVYRTLSSNPNLKSVRLDGTGDVTINTAFNLGVYPSSAIYDFKISPTSTRVIYRSNQENNSIVELFSANIDGSGLKVKLNSSIVSGGSVSDKFDFTPDGSRVVYIADQSVDELYELYSVGTLTGAASNMKISSSMVANGDVLSFKVTSDSGRVIYLADKQVDTAEELYSVSITGTNEFKVNSNLVAGRKVIDYLVLSNKIIYAMNRESSLYYDIFENSFSGGSENKMTEDNDGSGIGYYDNLFMGSQIIKDRTGDSYILSGSSSSVDKELYLYSGTTSSLMSKDGQSVALSNNYPSYIVYNEGVVFRATVSGKTNLYIFPR